MKERVVVPCESLQFPVKSCLAKLVQVANDGKRRRRRHHGSPAIPSEASNDDETGNHEEGEQG
jgi:hypothetical protein